MSIDKNINEQNAENKPMTVKADLDCLVAIHNQLLMTHPTGEDIVSIANCIITVRQLLATPPEKEDQKEEPPKKEDPKEEESKEEPPEKEEPKEEPPKPADHRPEKKQK